MVVFVCLFVYRIIAIKFLRFSSHSYKEPERIFAKIFLPKNTKIVNFKPPNILRISPSLEIQSTLPPGGKYVSTNFLITSNQRRLIKLSTKRFPKT